MRQSDSTTSPYILTMENRTVEHQHFSVSLVDGETRQVVISTFVYLLTVEKWEKWTLALMQVSYQWRCRTVRHKHFFVSTDGGEIRQFDINFSAKLLTVKKEDNWTSALLLTVEKHKNRYQGRFLRLNINLQSINKLFKKKYEC